MAKKRYQATAMSMAETIKRSYREYTEEFNALAAQTGNTDIWRMNFVEYVQAIQKKEVLKASTYKERRYNLHKMAIHLASLSANVLSKEEGQNLKISLMALGKDEDIAADEDYQGLMKEIQDVDSLRFNKSIVTQVKDFLLAHGYSKDEAGDWISSNIYGSD